MVSHVGNATISRHSHRSSWIGAFVSIQTLSALQSYGLTLLHSYNLLILTLTKVARLVFHSLIPKVGDI